MHTPGAIPMIDLNHIDDLARRLSGLVPPSMREGREELQQNFKAVLQSGLSRLDLVTREEFDVQRAVLLRTREKLDALEQLVEQLEARLAATPAAPQQHSAGRHVACARARPVHRRHPRTRATARGLPPRRPAAPRP